jgi:GAF domain-containing protein
VRIPISEGICGAAVREGIAINVPDVNSDPRYLACSVFTRSEIVVPIYNKKGEIVGEIDIDSDRPGAFDEDDRVFLEGIAKEIGEVWEECI